MLSPTFHLRGRDAYNSLHTIIAHIGFGMIPHRVKLAGFLSYKEEQSISFGGAPVWMLAGTNGSGKSSIFDAVTYALFGHHRGGSQNATELINKESSALLVEFDFKLDGKLFRIKRTLKRSAKGNLSSSQQVFALPDGEVENQDNWTAVSDTNKKVDFDKWIHEKIGLDYETFTSSVLLLQGKAEKLLDSKPSGRAEVLAGIVDLERFQLLHEKANTRKLGLKSQLDALSHQIEAVPTVSDEQLALAELGIESAEEAKIATRHRLDALGTAEIQSQRWVDACTRHGNALQKLRNAELLLGEAVAIERDFTRLLELRGVLPAVNTVVSVRTAMNESTRKVDRLKRERADSLDRKQKAEHERDLKRRERTQHQSQLTTDEDELRAGSARLRELTGMLQTVMLVENQEAAIQELQLQLSQLPTDPAAALLTARNERERLEALDRVLPILERVQIERHDLVQAFRNRETAQEKLQRTKTEGEQLKATSSQAAHNVTQARTDRSSAEQALAVARTLWDQARDALAEFGSLGSAKSCRACGQPLTPQHFAQEKQSRESASKLAEQNHTAAVSAHAGALERERSSSDHEKHTTEKLNALRELYRDCANELKQCEADIKRLTDSLNLRYAEMPEPYRGKISAQLPHEWPSTNYPERDDLIGLRREVAQLDAVRRVVREAEAIASKATDYRGKLEQAQSTMNTLRANLPKGELANLRQEHGTLQARERSLQNNIKAAKRAIEEADRRVDTLGAEAHSADQNLARISGELQTEQVKQDHGAQDVSKALTTLPEAWRALVQPAGLGEYTAWKTEMQELQERGTEARAKQLEMARSGLNTIRLEIESLQAEVDAFPDEAKKPPEAIRAQIAEARKMLDAHDVALREVERSREKLLGYREARVQLNQRFTELDGAHNKYKILAELLGRDRLQRHLVRQAERQIVDYGNSVLDRLSGGQLYLKLVGSDDSAGTDRALDLECFNRTTGGAPINVTFLSGSQRFRVAVSLALAIGQYASKQHRPIESVIIDEGFGCLDRQGRQVMIQELQNLRGHLHCILLVSHQEEFADAFADGYRFELHDGSTQVSRFQR